MPFNPDEYLAEKTKNGNTFNPDEYLASKVESVSNAPTPNASSISELESGARGALQAASLGFADEAIGGLGALWDKMSSDEKSKTFSELYKQHRDESRANNAKAESANPGSYLAGQVGGGVATALLPVAGAASVAGRLGLSAATGAAQGLGASNAEDATSLAKDAALGGGIGLVAGGLGEGLRAAAPAVGRALSGTANKAQTAAERLAVKATGATGKQASEYADDAGRYLLDNKYVQAFDSPTAISTKLDAGLQAAGSKIGSSIDEMAGAGVTVDLPTIITKLQTQADELMQTPGNEQLVSQILKQVDNLKARGSSSLPINVAEQAKRNYQGTVNYFSPEVDKKGATYLADAFKTEVENAAQNTTPELASKFIQAKKDYGMLAPMADAASKRVNTLNQNPIGGFNDLASGTSGAVMGGLPGMVTSMLGRRLITPRVTSTVAVGMDKISNLLRSSPEAFGKFAKPLMDAQARGASGLASTHFLLQNTNPEYRKTLEQFNGDK